MNPELVIGAALAAHAPLVALVGNRIAVAQLPPGTDFPALVFNVVDAIPRPEVAYQRTAQMATARVQINPIAATIPALKAIQDAVRAALDFKHNSVVSGKLIVSCRARLLGPMDRDDVAGVWTQPTDYELRWRE